MAGYRLRRLKHRRPPLPNVKFRLVWLQATETVKNKMRIVQRRDIHADALARYEDTAPRYNTATSIATAIRRIFVGGALLMVGGLPELGPLGAIGDRISFRRIVQTPGAFPSSTMWARARPGSATSS